MADSPAGAENVQHVTAAPAERVAVAANRLAEVERLDEYRDAGLLIILTISREIWAACSRCELSADA